MRTVSIGLAAVILATVMSGCASPAKPYDPCANPDNPPQAACGNLSPPPAGNSDCADVNDNPACSRSGPSTGGNEDASVSMAGGNGRVTIQLVKGGKNVPYAMSDTTRNAVYVDGVLCALKPSLAVGSSVYLDGSTQGGQCSSHIHAGQAVQIKIILQHTLIREERVTP